MEFRRGFRNIAPQTGEWTCKVQVIEKSRPKQSKDGRTRFQLGIVQDEMEEHVDFVIYGAEIDRFKKKLIPFCTYLITTTTVRKPLGYGVPANAFEWVIDKKTVVMEIAADNIEDPPLATPTNLNIVSLADCYHQPESSEFNILAVVLSCGASRFAGVYNNKCQRIVVTDRNLRPCTLSLWGDFADIEGSELAGIVHEHPIILAKRIARSSYADGKSLTTRYKSAILINPRYEQAASLMNWVNENKYMLNTYTQTSSSDATSSSFHVPLPDEVILIENIQLQPPTQPFHVEGTISLLDEYDQLFYQLMCPKCKHFVRTSIKQAIDCVYCDQHAMLTPSCHFQVEIADRSGSVIATILGEYGEKLLSMITEQIYEITRAQQDPFPFH